MPRRRTYLIGGVAVVAAAGIALATASPPAVLNLLDRLTPGDGAVHQVVDGAAFGPDAMQRLDVWAPKVAAATPRPVLIFWYGGAWVKGTRQEYGFAGRAYANRGFVVVVPDYRHVPGVRFPAFVQDGASAIKWTRDHIAAYGGDPKRITLSGHSAGAYIAALLALDGRYLSAIGVDPKIVRASAPLAGPYDFYPWDSYRSVDAMSNWPRPAETQPITFAAKDSPPMWLGFGSADTVVKPRNSRNLAARLKQLGSRVVLREYPGKSHDDLVMGLSKPFRGRAPTLDETSAFLTANSR